MRVELHSSAQVELAALPEAERDAMVHALEKLEALGSRLSFPHQSAVKGVPNLRELRPRSGRSRWRAFYRLLGEGFVIAAVGPEANVNRREFNRTVLVAIERLDSLSQGEPGR